MLKTSDLSAKIDALLPQTQCGLCEYPGCKPYADAIAEKGERIDRCLPGGITVLKKLGDLLQKDPSPYLAEMEEKQKSETLVVIREEDCIGCTKCIQACPVDAIIGAAKLMHTVISDVCTGCDLCIPACPVDCIDIVNISERSEIEKKIMAKKSRERYEKRNFRLEKITSEEKAHYLRAKDPLTLTLSRQGRGDEEARKLAIQEMLLRVKEKKR